MAELRTRLSGPVIGCSDAWELAEFYAALLGWQVVARSEQAPGVWALVRSPGGEQKLEFQREEPFVPPVWPTMPGEQQMGMHLDIGIRGLDPITALDGFDDMDPEEQAAAIADLERAVEERNQQMVRHAERLGARVARQQPQLQRGVVVMLDPAGHPFCLFPDE